MAAKIMIQPVESRTFMNPAEGQRTVSFTGRFRVTGGGFAGSVVVSSAGCRVAEAKLPPGRALMYFMIWRLGCYQNSSYTRAMLKLGM